MCPVIAIVASCGVGCGPCNINVVEKVISIVGYILSATVINIFCVVVHFEVMGYLWCVLHQKIYLTFYNHHDKLFTMRWLRVVDIYGTEMHGTHIQKIILLRCAPLKSNCSI